MTKAIEIKKLGKKYSIFHEKGALVRDIPLWFLGIKKYEELWALQHIDLEVNAGECLGIIGGNGAGKSTLLNILSGITFPTQGAVKLNGKISAILSLGAGFHPELTGEENIYLNASILGLGLAEIKERFKEIVEFSGLKDFIDVPLRTYSAGMYMRLGFSVAIHTDFDILLIDEIISVGDEEAQQKCIKKIFELKESGKTIVVASHNMNMISELCNRVILLERGKVVQEGLAAQVVPYYLETVRHKKNIKVKETNPYLQYAISSGNLRLLADLENKVIELYYKDTKITKGIGLDSPFFVSQGWFLLKEAGWNIQKISQEELILTLYSLALSVKQVWTLACTHKDTLEIKIEIEGNKPISLTKLDVRLEVTDKYKNWITAYEEGNFLVNQCVNNIFPIRLKDNKVSQVMLKSETDNHLPYLFFEAPSRCDRQLLGIYKRREGQEEYVCLNFSPIITREERLINPGKYTYFEGKIILDKEVKLNEEYASAQVVELNKGGLRFVFDQGKGRIFFEEKELTSGLGAYTSVRSSGVWHDSYQAAWKVNQKDDNKIVVFGDWPYLPISQISQIELIDENSILWTIDMEIHEEVDLEIEQVNLMLSSGYKTWVVPDVNKGKFLDEYSQDYDISPFRFWYGKSDQIEVKTLDADLPSVSFKCNQKEGRFRAIVENTDYLYKARLLQYQKSNTAKLLPKKYIYFEGVIKIGLKG